MTIKTFKSPLPDSNYKFEIGKNYGAEHLFARISDGGVDSISMALAPADAPALCLAILESAGFTDTHDSEAGTAADYLSVHIASEAKRTAEARELAELEAEALEFLHVAQKHNNIPLTESWDGFMDGGTKLLYVNMARKAREINK